MGCIDRKVSSGFKLTLLSFILSLFWVGTGQISGRSQTASTSPKEAPTLAPNTSQSRLPASAIGSPLLWLPAILVLGYGGIFWLRPLWLLQLDRRLKSSGIDLSLWLAYHPRALDAWVEVHLVSVRRWFESGHPLEESFPYIWLPVTLNGKIVLELAPRDLRSTFALSDGCVAIVGEGGAGKTTLAVQIGRWAMDADPQTRLAAHQMLPIWLDLIRLEREFQGDRTLIDILCTQLQAATGETIFPKLVESLLRYSRLLVLADGLSSIQSAPRKWLDSSFETFPTAARVLTSSSFGILEKASVAVPMVRIELRPLNGAALANFLEVYLQWHQKRHLFDNEEFFEICHHLSSLVGDRQIVPLYAKLYADWTIERQQNPNLDRQPENIPDLILDYFERLTVRDDGFSVTHSTLERHARAIAWECLKQTYQPTFVNERDALAAVVQSQGGNRARAKAELEDLIESTHVLQRFELEGSEDRVGFMCSTLAEYLAGLYLVEIFGEDETLWREFLATLDAREGTPDSIRNFLLAVRDCAIVRQKGLDIPSWLPKQLGERAGLDPEILQQAQLKHRLRDLISQLSLPDTHLRQRAAARLGQMGVRAASAVSTLVKALEDEDERVRLHASVALAEIGVDAVPALVNAFKKDNKEVRSGAAFALERMGTTAIPALVEALELEDSEVLSGTAFALERMGTSAIPALVEALKKGDNNVRVLTSIVLGRIGGSAVGDLVEAFQQGNAAVRHHAANALGSMGAEAKEAVPAFEAALQDRNKEVRSSAVFVLERIGAAAVPALQQALGHEDWLVRRSAADALGRIGTEAKATIPELESACGDRDKYVREAAEEALRLIRGPKSGV